MDAFIQLSREERRSACLELQSSIGLQAESVEKDFWVCWTLKELFALPSMGEHLTFKEALGFAGESAPDKAASKKQRKVRLEALMEAARRWVQETLQPALSLRLRSVLGESGWKLEVDPDTPDGQCLLLHYPSAFSEKDAGYILPHVKIAPRSGDDSGNQVMERRAPLLGLKPTPDAPRREFGRLRR